MSVQLAITLSPSTTPTSIINKNPSLTHIGQVGQLADVQLFSVPKETWDTQEDPILAHLKSEEGVLRVDVQTLRGGLRGTSFECDNFGIVINIYIYLFSSTRLLPSSIPSSTSMLPQCTLWYLDLYYFPWISL
ncbi:hypothetical protein BDQ17DRAFT_1421808 [Cyathus striatus]|nr:hypothetical protein BDQ17DRAFT_1421808 [Cyathus striatus]